MVLRSLLRLLRARLRLLPLGRHLGLARPNELCERYSGGADVGTAAALNTGHQVVSPGHNIGHTRHRYYPNR